MGISDLQFKIIKRAIKTRLANGEAFEDIIADYPKLSDAQVEAIKAELGYDKDGES